MIRDLLRRSRPAFRVLCNLFVVWAYAASSLAQDIDYGDYYDGDPNAPPKTYVPVYIIMIAFVGLALTLVCRTSRRQADFRSTE